MKKNKIKKIFLEDFPKWGKEGKGNEGNIKWEEINNTVIRFIYNGIEDNLLLLFHEKDGNKIHIKYKEETYIMNASNLIACKIGKILKTRTGAFKYNIGERLLTYNEDGSIKRDLTITDKKYKNRDRENGKQEKQKWYKCYCNLCGFDGGKYYSIKDKQYKDEFWIEESSLLRGYGCSCCCESSNIVVENINSVYYTDKWMIPYIGEEIAKTHTHSSNEFCNPICPDCGKIKKQKMMINTIFRYRSIRCECSDKISYPEKFTTELFNQLNINFQTQLTKTTFKWCTDYQYDFYFKYNNEQYVCEVHGEQHYEQTRRKGGRSLQEEQLNDELKKELALKNGIKPDNYIIIDCRKSTLEWIRDNKNGILNSRLNEIFKLDKIDWLKCEEFALSNLVKLACEYKKNDAKLTTFEIGKMMGYNRVSIGNWLKKGNELGWCYYNVDEEKEKGRQKAWG